MRDMLVELAALRLITTHILARLGKDELREISENISKELQTVGE